ncbi:MAG: DUF3368 domain-containing protein [Nitrospirae bacterium]|nr:DUF3368 domain-containing protein [Nitrospirota bacterium]
MRVVVNATPIIALSRIKKLELLHKIYRKVFIAKEVFAETVEFSRGKPDVSSIESSSFLEVTEVKNMVGVEMLLTELDRGESETIVLAKEINADLIIMDEKLGREIAELKGLKITGTIGVLIEAKYRKLIPEVREYLDLLRNKGVWVSTELYNKVVKELKEQ